MVLAWPFQKRVEKNFNNREFVNQPLNGRKVKAVIRINLSNYSGNQFS